MITIANTSGEIALPMWLVVTVLLLPSVISLITVALTFLSEMMRNSQKNKLEEFNIIYMQKLKIVQDFAKAYGNLSKSIFGDFIGCTYAAITISDSDTQKDLQLMLSSFITGDEEKSGAILARCTKIVVALTDSINKI